MVGISRHAAAKGRIVECAIKPFHNPRKARTELAVWSFGIHRVISPLFDLCAADPIAHLRVRALFWIGKPVETAQIPYEQDDAFFCSGKIIHHLGNLRKKPVIVGVEMVVGPFRLAGADSAVARCPESDFGNVKMDASRKVAGDAAKARSRRNAVGNDEKRFRHRGFFLAHAASPSRNHSSQRGQRFAHAYCGSSVTRSSRNRRARSAQSAGSKTGRFEL